MQVARILTLLQMEMVAAAVVVWQGTSLSIVEADQKVRQVVAIVPEVVRKCSKAVKLVG